MERGESSRNYSRRIPCPLGIVQVAFARKERGKSPEDNRIYDTQKFIRREIKEPIKDDTFRNNSWLKVINYRYLDMVDYTPITTILP